MSIENAAKEIARVELEEMNEGLGYECIADIIRSHLFPVVKPEEVAGDKWYWVKIGNAWGFASGEIASKFKSVSEICGPVPMPE